MHHDKKLHFAQGKINTIKRSGKESVALWTRFSPSENALSCTLPAALSTSFKWKLIRIFLLSVNGEIWNCETRESYKGSLCNQIVALNFAPCANIYVVARIKIFNWENFWSSCKGWINSVSYVVLNGCKITHVTLKMLQSLPETKYKTESLLWIRSMTTMWVKWFPLAYDPRKTAVKFRR